jgi:hypothetical protein
LEGPIEYWHITTGEQAQLGIDGDLIKRQGREPAEETMINSYVCIIDVPDRDGYLKQIQKHDDRMAIETRVIPNIGWIAYCFDTHQNLFGILQPDMSAK